MSPKRGDRVAPPATGSLWDLRFATSEAAKGWDELCRQAAANTLVAYEEMRRREVEQEPTPRHHRLKGRLATGVHNGAEMEQWQYEVTAGGRIWYLLDIERRTVWLKYAGTAHPKQTE
ncbi:MULTISPECIES: hypothetical protein [Rhodococcus erythropolis group]|uniref:hypothetical protein n=1 Tax=Rhodococcus erythropolis group TaxID=2840174 RepID=UPI0005A9D3B1|nr:MULTISPECIES: hypothetical protein [Rhodococcus erythropolis group]QXC46721.1 hypothetical protein KSE96_32080 [Rhodococcus qingshengii]